MNNISLPSHTLPTRTVSLLSTLLVTLGMLVFGAPAANAAPVVATPAIVPFSEWAPAACPAPTGEEPTATKRLVVHHTHEPVAHTPEEVLPALALTCSAHTDRGFSTIGYHYVVDPWGTIYQGRGGMPRDDGSPPTTQAQGAHVAGTNTGAVGVVFLGDHEDEPPTAAALEAATHLLAWLLEPTGRDPAEHVPVVSSGVGTARHTGPVKLDAVAGHSASNHTACPGEHLRGLLPAIGDRMRQLLAGEAPAGWAGLAVDQPAQADAAGADPADAAEPAAEDAANPADEPAPADAADRAGQAGLEVAAQAIGPRASPAELLARSLRESGFDSLAERVFRQP